MQIIVTDIPDQLLLDLQVVLVKTLGCQFHLFQDVDQAIAHIEKNKDIILVISRYEIKKVSVYNKMNDYLTKFGSNAPPHVCRSLELLPKTSILKLKEDKLDSAVAHVLDLTNEIVLNIQKKKMSYIAVAAEKFLTLEVENLVCDVFIRIEKKGHPDQFVKRLHASDKFSVDEIFRYMNLGLKEFYIPEFQYSKFLNMISIEIIRSLKNQRFEKLDKTQLISFAFETVIDRLKVFNLVDDITIHLVNENIKTISKSIEKNDALSDFFQTLSFQKSTYAFSHSYLIALLSEKLSKFFEWNSPQARDKLVYLAFFHDITLTNLEWHKIDSLKELEAANLKKSDKDIILNHATTSADILNKFKEIPFGLSQLVKEHHGVKSGVGFTEELSIGISPMAMMFVVLEDFASHYIKGNIQNHEDLDKIFTYLEHKYTKLAYQQTVLSLKSIIKNDQLG